MDFLDKTGQTAARTVFICTFVYLILGFSHWNFDISSWATDMQAMMAAIDMISFLILVAVERSNEHD